MNDLDKLTPGVLRHPDRPNTWAAIYEGKYIGRYPSEAQAIAARKAYEHQRRRVENISAQPTARKLRTRAKQDRALHQAQHETAPMPNQPWIPDQTKPHSMYWANHSQQDHSEYFQTLCQYHHQYHRFRNEMIRKRQIDLQDLQDHPGLVISPHPNEPSPADWLVWPTPQVNRLSDPPAWWQPGPEHLDANRLRLVASIAPEMPPETDWPLCVPYVLPDDEEV